MYACSIYENQIETFSGAKIQKMADSEPFTTLTFHLPYSVSRPLPFRLLARNNQLIPVPPVA